MKRMLRFTPFLVLLALISQQAAAQLQADFTVTAHSGCAPVQVSFTDASTGNPTSYLWDFGIGSPVSTKGPHLKTYSTPGLYIVSLTVTDVNGSSTKTDTIIVYGKPQIQTISGNITAGCVPLQNVHFTGSALTGAPAGASQNLSYFWDFGDGSSPSNATQQNPTHSYTSAGVFNISLSVTNSAGCQSDSTRSLYINVYPLPQPSFTVSPNLYACGAPATLTFTNTSTGAAPSRASWTFGDGSGTFSGNSLSHTYTAANSYIVTMHDTDAHGCVSVNPAYATRTVTVYPNQPAFTMSPSPACVNEAVTFTNSSPGTLYTDWDYGDGVIDQTGVHAYTSAGTYSVKMTAHIGLYCTSTLTKNIVVHPLPQINVTSSPAVPCPAPTTVTFTASSPGSSSGTTYSWSFDGTPFGSNSTSSQTYTFTSSGYRHYQVTATDPVTGCSSTKTENNFPIYPLIAFLSPKSPNPDTAGCVPFSPDLILNLFTNIPPPPPNTPLPPYPVGADTTKFVWTFYNANPTPDTSHANSPTTYTWDSVGTYKVVVTGMTLNGCPFKDSIYVHADTPVVPSFTVSPAVNCPKVPFTFTNTSPYNPSIQYKWDLEDTMFNWGPWISGFQHDYDVPGKHYPRLTTKHNGCISTYPNPDSNQVLFVTVNPSNAAFSYMVQCGTYKVQFKDLSVGATSWHWDFGDGDTSNLQNPLHTYASNNIYHVHLHTNNNIYGCSDDTTMAVNVFNVASALSIMADKDTFCVGEKINLSASFPGPTITPQFSWQVDGGPIGLYTENTDTSIIFLTRGLHSITLRTTYDSACSSSVTRTDFLAARPLVGFVSSDSIGCTPLFIQFTDTSSAVPGTTIVARDWNFGDTTFSSGNNKNVSHTYLNRGYKTPVLTVTDNIGCMDSLHRYGMIDARHTKAYFLASQTIVCVNDTVHFTNQTVGDSASLNYLWNFGDGTTATVRNANHAFVDTGTYQVRLTAVDNAGCSDSFVVSVHAKGPTASFTKDKSFSTCKSLKVHFANTSTGAISYVWDMGDGVTLTNTPSVYSYGTPGKYIIRLSATDGDGCTDYATDSVFLLGYRGSFSYEPTDACAGDTIRFRAAVSNIPQINWDFGDGTGAVSKLRQDTFHVYQSGGTYNPVVIYDGGEGCGRAFDSGLASIHIEKLKADFASTTPCISVPFQLHSTTTSVFSPANAWHWKLSATDTANGDTTSYRVDRSGPYPITLYVANAWGCLDSITKNVFIHPLPHIDAGPADTGICPGDTIRLTGRGGLSYVWGPDSLVSCTNCTVTLVSSAKPTMYYVIGTDSNGCVNQDSIRAHIQIQTTSNVLPGGDICIGESFRLHASGATTYQWQPERFLDSPDIASPLATPIITTHYVVAAQEGTCLVRYDTVTVVVHPTPYFDAGDDQVINYGSSVTLNPTRNGIARIEWRPDSTLSCLDCFDPVAHPSFTTIYFAKAYSEYGCSDSDSVVVRVRCNGDSVFIPNTFTPNGDGLNDVFFPRGKGIAYISSMRIFNRWGEMVFEKQNFPLNDEQSGWDGRYRGKELPPDVFMYTIQTRCATGEPLVWKGDVTLLR